MTADEQEVTSSVSPTESVSTAQLISDHDRWLFSEGAHSRLFELLGAQPLTSWSAPGRRFAVWAPSATRVWVVGDFNGWNVNDAYALTPQGDTGIWAGVAADAQIGDRYKFRITTPHGYDVERADPVAFASELAPATASVVTDLTYEWSDDSWLAGRPNRQRHDQPISVYEMHVGSWRHPEAYQSFDWNTLAEPLAEHLHANGFTHVELMPITEHPFYGSWGYQTTSYFAPTPRYGLPTELMGFIDKLHNNDLGVILDWVPSHFPSDEFALGRFDGSPLYEHADPKEGWHPDWNSYIFNYGRHEVRAFLISSALSWIERYHLDGIRVDAVASMLYRDYSREAGEWIPNKFGGRENLEAIDFLRQLNQTIGESHPDVLTIAEESTSFPGVTRPVSDGGLGFHYKWDMGWMHDTLEYFEFDPVHRRFHHDDVTRRGMWAFSENYVLPLSHDEVVHGKGSLLSKMPGDEWQQFANLRLLYANQWCSPGKKLLFMGQELGQAPEWHHDHPIAWAQLDAPLHRGVMTWVAELNRLYRAEPALHQLDNHPDGFEWVVLDDGENSVVAWLRYPAQAGADVGDSLARPVLCVMNHTPLVRSDYRIGVPDGSQWEVLVNSDEARFGGTGAGSSGVIDASSPGAHGREHALSLELPPLGAVILAPTR